MKSQSRVEALGSLDVRGKWERGQRKFESRLVVRWLVNGFWCGLAAELGEPQVVQSRSQSFFCSWLMLVELFNSFDVVRIFLILMKAA